MKKLLRYAFLFLVSAGVANGATPITITFDDLPAVGPQSSEPVPQGYNGFQWSNFYVVDPLDDPISNGGQNGVESPPNVAFNAGGLPANFSSNGAFDFDSAYMTAVWNDGLQVEVQGFVGSTLTYDNTYTLATTGPALVNFNYFGVDEVNFIASGGTHHSGYSGGSGTQFVIDNLTVVVPEPGSILLLLFGSSVIGLSGLRSRFTNKLGWYERASA